MKSPHVMLSYFIAFLKSLRIFIYKKEQSIKVVKILTVKDLFIQGYF